MPSPETFCLDQAPSPISSLCLTNYTSTPTSSTPGGNESLKSSQTPVKCIGYLYNSQQYKTPNTRNQGWSGLRQSSPCVKTPGSGASGLGQRLTPRLRTPASNHSSKKSTPAMHTPGQPYNPFDSNLLDRLDGSVFSPNVFAEVRSASQTPKTFQWTVDELAILKPVDIDELVHQPDAIGAQADNDMERRAQEVIDAYFAQNMIAPSPWSENGKSKPFVLPHTPKAPGNFCDIDSPMTFADRKTPVAAEKKKSPSRDTGCQTTLTLPVDFDIERVLGDYFTHTKHRESEEGCVQELMSMSSLRRKLFFHGEEGIPPSPVKPSKTLGTDHMDYDISPTMSPVKNIHKTPKQCRRSPMETPTPSSAQFSSSPISSSRGNPLTPFLRRCSTDPDLMASPGFSPISSNTHSQPSHLMTPLCHPLQATPGSERMMRPFDSPGMSPIIQHEGSFVTSPQSQIEMPKRRRRPDKVPLPSELLAHSDIDEDDDHSFQQMDVEADQLAKIKEEEDLSFICSQENQFTQARHHDPDETQYSDDELSNQESCQTYFVSHASQDTGYNTNSLQLTTNQDPSLHTNLTQQFSSFPFSSQDATTDMDISSTESSRRPTKKPIVRHLALKSRSRGAAEDDKDGQVLNDREVRRRAKQVLGRSISMDDSQLGASLDSSTLKPRLLLNSIGVPAFTTITPQLGLGQPSDQKILPSELASHVLQKAGDDYRRYCEAPHKQPDDAHEYVLDSPQDQYYFVNMDSDVNTQGLRVSMSAEF